MESEYYDKAKRKVAEKKKFHRHLESYIITNLIMVFTGVFWRGWYIAALFWGIGLFSHFVKAYGFMGLNDDSEWEEREIEKEVKRLKSSGQSRSTQMPMNNSRSKRKDDFDIDDHLDLNQAPPLPIKKYDEEDLV